MQIRYWIAIILISNIVIAAVSVNMASSSTRDRIMDEFLKDSIRFAEINHMCRTTQFEVATPPVSKEICYGGDGENGYIEFELFNTGKDEFRIGGVIVTGTRGIYQNRDIGKLITPKNSIRHRFDYDFNKYGDIRSVKFTPQVEYQNEIIYCADFREVDSENISKCDQ